MCFLFPTYFEYLLGAWLNVKILGQDNVSSVSLNL